jgi:hypothetical protein
MSETEGTEEPDGFGLDKESRLQSKREREAEGRPQPLDPPFPYRVIKVDAVIFGS